MPIINPEKNAKKNKNFLFCGILKELRGLQKAKNVCNRQDFRGLGTVQLETPLVARPVVLIIISEYGLAATLISVVVNIMLVGIIFSEAEAIRKCRILNIQVI